MNIPNEFSDFHAFRHQGTEFLALRTRGHGDNWHIISKGEGVLHSWGAWSSVERFKARRENTKDNEQFGVLTPNY